MVKQALLVASTILLAGCGAMNNFLAEKFKTVEYYRIFDVRTAARRADISKAASDGLGRNVNRAEETTPIPTFGVAPAAPGRFALVSPSHGSPRAMFAARPMDVRVVVCDGAVWTATALRNVAGANSLKLTACLFPYSQGYHLDLYAVFTKEEGGLYEVSRQAAYAMVGTPEQWTEKTFLDIVRSIRDQTGAEIAFVEGFPELSGTPWLDRGEVIGRAK